MFQTEVVGKIRTHILCSLSFFFPENLVVYETLWKIMGESDRPHTSILRRMRFTCWISKSTDAISECIILAAFPLQHWLRERASMIRLYVHCLSDVETGCWWDILYGYSFLCKLGHRGTRTENSSINTVIRLTQNVNG
jgi:hypothetical protein